MKHIHSRQVLFTLGLIVISLSACTPAAAPTPANPVLEAAATPTPPPAATDAPTDEPTGEPEPTPEASPTQLPTAEPTLDSGYQAILDYFLVTASGACQKLEDGSPDTLITANCEFGDVDVHLDQYASPSTMNAYMDFVQSEYPSGAGEQWTDSCTSSPGGIVYTFMELDDSAWLLWSVNGQNMTGEAVRNDGNMDALKAWWETEGVQHPCP